MSEGKTLKIDYLPGDFSLPTTMQKTLIVIMYEILKQLMVRFVF